MLHPFRCEIEQLHSLLLEILQHNILFQPSESGVKRRNRNLALLHGRHLILHERNERRNDQRQSRQHGRRQLITERLALARRHHRHDIAPSQHGTYHVFLAGSECRKPESVLELLSQISHGISRRSMRGAEINTAREYR